MYLFANTSDWLFLGKFGLKLKKIIPWFFYYFNHRWQDIVKKHLTVYNSVCPLVRIGTPMHPLSRMGVYPPPPQPKGGGRKHSPAGEGVGGSQFGRLLKKPSTLSTLWCAPLVHHMQSISRLLARGRDTGSCRWDSISGSPPSRKWSNLRHYFTACELDWSLS
jgi:hypothetical protein